MTTPERFATEVIDLHRFFQDWFNGTIPKNEQVFQRVAAVWPESFVLVDKRNGLHDAASILQDTYDFHGAFPKLKIHIRGLVVTEIPGTSVAVARYEEWHVDENETEARLCSATLVCSPESGSVRWVHIHESKIEFTGNPQVHLMKITEGGLDDPCVQKLLAHHFNTAHAETGRGSAHALDLTGLKVPDVYFWSAWDGDHVIAIGALKRLSESHGEIKSMHTDQSQRRKGVGSAMLEHIIAEGRKMGMSRLSLETGSWPYFNDARQFYRRHGFVECSPFGNYVADPNSVFMTLELRRES
jgi:putative acetyltransferase